jgi:hypothetical protein
MFLPWLHLVEIPKNMFFYCFDGWCNGLDMYLETYESQFPKDS